MDPVDQAIAAVAAEPQPIVLTLASTGRQAILPPNVSVSELVDLAGWAQTQALQALVMTIAKQQGPATVLHTPMGPLAIRRDT
jgi:polysaccharide deacetylase 2 family uncharacterized protein YibQ